MIETGIPSSHGSLFGLLEIPYGTDGEIPGVVLLHGFTSDRDESPIAGTEDTIFRRTATRLAEAGFATLRFDFAGHGKSQELPFEEIDLPGLVDDATCGISYLARRPEISRDLFLIGQSMGGLVAACAAHRDDRIRGVALWNAPSNPLYTLWSTMGVEAVTTALVHGAVEFLWDGKGPFRLKRRFFETLMETVVLEQMSMYRGPLLVVAGKNDELVRPQPETAEAFLHVHAGVHRLLMLDGDHTFNVTDGQTGELDATILATIDWFAQVTEDRHS